jgi:hypothetical protein
MWKMDMGGSTYIDSVNSLIRIVRLRSAVASDIDVSFRHEDVAFWRTLGVQANLRDAQHQNQTIGEKRVPKSKTPLKGDCKTRRSGTPHLKIPARGGE